MKIAFCFLTRNDLLQPKVWEGFFSNVAPERYTVYCHHKEVDHIASPIIKGRVIGNRVATRHGDVSLVKATLNLLSEAHGDDGDNQYFILLSKSTIPIVPFDELYDGVKRCNPLSIISYRVPPPNSEHYQRLFSTSQPALFWPAFFYHEQWIILHRQHVERLLDHPGLALFSNVFAPDEHYFMNVLVHLKGASTDQFVNRRATFANWHDMEVKTCRNRATGKIVSRTIHPKTYYRLSAADLQEAINGDCWFFRKVAAECDCTVVFERMRREIAAP